MYTHVARVIYTYLIVALQNGVAVAVACFAQCWWKDVRDGLATCHRRSTRSISSKSMNTLGSSRCFGKAVSLETEEYIKSGTYIYIYRVGEDTKITGAGLSLILRSIHFDLARRHFFPTALSLAHAIAIYRSPVSILPTAAPIYFNSSHISALDSRYFSTIFSQFSRKI